MIGLLLTVVLDAVTSLVVRVGDGETQLFVSYNRVTNGAAFFHCEHDSHITNKGSQFIFKTMDQPFKFFDSVKIMHRED